MAAFRPWLLSSSAALSWDGWVETGFDGGELVGVFDFYHYYGSPTLLHASWTSVPPGPRGRKIPVYLPFVRFTLPHARPFCWCRPPMIHICSSLVPHTFPSPLSVFVSEPSSSHPPRLSRSRVTIRFFFAVLFVRYYTRRTLPLKHILRVHFSVLG